MYNNALNLIRLNISARSTRRVWGEVWILKKRFYSVNFQQTGSQKTVRKKNPWVAFTDFGVFFFFSRQSFSNSIHRSNWPVPAHGYPAERPHSGFANGNQPAWARLRKSACLGKYLNDVSFNTQTQSPGTAAAVTTTCWDAGLAFTKTPRSLWPPHMVLAEPHPEWAQSSRRHPDSHSSNIWHKNRTKLAHPSSLVKILCLLLLWLHHLHKVSMATVTELHGPMLHLQSWIHLWQQRNLRLGLSFQRHPSPETLRLSNVDNVMRVLVSVF